MLCIGQKRALFNFHTDSAAACAVKFIAWMDVLGGKLFLFPRALAWLPYPQLLEAV